MERAARGRKRTGSLITVVVIVSLVWYTSAAFLSMRLTVDVIYTWVNGMLVEQYRGKPSGAATMRAFRDYGILRFSIRSLFRFAPWVNRVFILTNGQETPAWLNKKAPGLTIVTHADVFENVSHLPTFNSNAIEAHLRRVPKLSECFMYMNDDFFLARDTPLSHFVNEDTGKLKLYMDGFKAPETEAMKTNTWHRSVARTNELLDAWYNPGTEPVRRNYAGHHCYFMRKSVLNTAWNRWRSEYEVTSSHRFRQQVDIATPFLQANLALEEGLATKERSPNIGGSWTSNSTTNMALWRKVQKKKPFCVCLQDGLDETENSEREIAHLERLLCKMLPKPSPLEKGTNPCT
eukprot:m51a1_g12269 hypothetical protein (348) ;mRNA; f:212886-214384